MNKELKTDITVGNICKAPAFCSPGNRHAAKTERWRRGSAATHIQK